MRVLPAVRRRPGRGRAPELRRRGRDAPVGLFPDRVQLPFRPRLRRFSGIWEAVVASWRHCYWPWCRAPAPAARTRQAARAAPRTRMWHAARSGWPGRVRSRRFQTSRMEMTSIMDSYMYSCALNCLETVWKKREIYGLRHHEIKCKKRWDN